MHSRSWFLGWVLALIVILPAQAQHPLTMELETLGARYAEAAHLSFEVQYQLYANATSGQPIEELKGTVKKSGERMEQELGPILTLQTEDYFLRIDHEDRNIVMLDRKMKDKDLGLFPTPSLDSMLVAYASVTKSSTADGKYRYVFEGLPKDPRFSGYEIWVDPLTGYIHKLVFHFQDASMLDNLLSEDRPRLEITYTNYSQSTIEPAELDRSAYLQRQKRQWSPLPAYASYQFQYQPF